MTNVLKNDSNLKKMTFSKRFSNDVVDDLNSLYYDENTKDNTKI